MQLVHPERNGLAVPAHGKLEWVVHLVAAARRAALRRILIAEATCGHCLVELCLERLCLLFAFALRQRCLALHVRPSLLTDRRELMRKRLDKHFVARDEVLIQALAHELATVREETRTNVERKAALTEREREEEAEALEAELDEAVATGGLGYEDAPERGTPGGGDKMYNPLKLPMGWDGKPIPFWMYKLHGLRVEYKCEICSDHVYKGRKVFEKHFGESRHAFGMRALGLPNTAPFRGVTRIQEAFALAEKLKQQSRANYVDEDDTVEVEDEHGNVRSARGCTDTGIYPQDVRATQAPGSFVVYSAVAVFLPACPAARHAVWPTSTCHVHGCPPPPDPAPTCPTLEALEWAPDRKSRPRRVKRPCPARSKARGVGRV